MTAQPTAFGARPKLKSFLIKPKYRDAVAALAESPAKPFYLRQKVRSRTIDGKKFKGKARAIYYRYTVRIKG